MGLIRYRVIGGIIFIIFQDDVFQDDVDIQY